MSGELYGAFFKSILSRMLSSELLFPEYHARVAEMQDDVWYPWSEYKEMVNAIAGKLRPFAVRAVGSGLMRDSKPIFEGQGFESADDIFSRWELLMTANVRGIPPEDGAYIVLYEPGHLVIDYSTVQPAALCEGYLRGAAQIFGSAVTSLETEEVERDGHPFMRFDLRWL